LFQSMGGTCALLQQLQALSFRVAIPEDSKAAQQQQEGLGVCKPLQGDSSSTAQQTIQKQYQDSVSVALQLLALLLEQGCQAVSGSASAQQLDQLSFAVQVAESALRLLARASPSSSQQQQHEHKSATLSVATDVQNVQDQQRQLRASSSSFRDCADPLGLAADKSHLAVATTACTRLSNAAVAVALQHIKNTQQQTASTAAQQHVPLATAAASQQGQRVPGLGLQQGHQLLQAVLSLVLTVTKVQRLTAPPTMGSLHASSSDASSSSDTSMPHWAHADLAALLLQPACVPEGRSAGFTCVGGFGACGALLMAHAGYMLGLISGLTHHYRAVHLFNCRVTTLRGSTPDVSELSEEAAHEAGAQAAVVVAAAAAAGRLDRPDHLLRPCPSSAHLRPLCGWCGASWQLLMSLSSR
jgi:hypothetical protein